MEEMDNQIDHVVWACSDLESGIEEIHALTGVRAQIGGKHPSLGTHNALMHLGDRCYFEIVAPDPEQDGGPWSRSLQEMAEPGLLHWAIAHSGLRKYSNGLSGLIGGDNEVIAISRQHPELGMLNWEILMLPRHCHGCLVPFLIDWGKSPHPAELLEQGCTLTGVRITTPELSDMTKIISWLGVDADVAEGATSKLEFAIETPTGEVTLTTPLPLPTGVTFTG